MASPRAIQRVVRFVLLAAVVVTVGLFLRDRQTYTIPELDRSMEPFYPAGVTVGVEEIRPGDPLGRGTDVVYAMGREKGGASREYARFGRVRGLPGDIVGEEGGRLTVNGELLVPPLLGSALGTVPEGKVCILAVNPGETQYPDSRTLGFIDRAQVRAVIRYKTGG